MKRAREELRELGSLAVPLIGTQVAGVALPWTDAIVLARLGPVHLAGGGLGTTLLSTATIVVGCLLGGLSAMIARARTAGDQDRARAYAQQARLASVALALPCVLVAVLARPLFALLRQPDDLADGASLYLAGAAPAFLTMPLATVQRHLYAALRRPKIVTLVWMSAVPLNALLDVALGFGVGPIPSLGVMGIGIATSVVSLTIVCSLELVLRRVEPAFAAGRDPRPDLGVLRSILGLGVPIAIAVGAEVGVFAAAVIVVGWFGADALAAHHVAIQTTQLLFLAPNGWAQAVSVRVASKAEHAARVGLRVAGCVSVGAATAVALGSSPIVRLYFPDEDSEAARTAGVLLLWVAAFHVADALQVVAAGILRGQADTRTAMRWGLMAYAGVAPAVGLVAALWLDLGVRGVWVGLATGLWFAAIGLIHRALGSAAICVLADQRTGHGSQ